MSVTPRWLSTQEHVWQNQRQPLSQLRAIRTTSDKYITTLQIHRYTYLKRRRLKRNAVRHFWILIHSYVFRILAQFYKDDAVGADVSTTTRQQNERQDDRGSTPDTRRYFFHLQLPGPPGFLANGYRVLLRG